MAHDNWQPVTRDNPCPVCHGPDNCTVSEDGGAVWCGRVEDGSSRQNSGGQWLHRLDSEFRNDAVPTRTRLPQSCQPNSEVAVSTARAETPNWSRLNLLLMTSPQLHDRRLELADQLGVTVESLEQLGVAWSDHRECWTIPERDSDGAIIGLNCRYRDGSKKQWPGGSRGLTYALDWKSRPGPVFLVEGGSDTAALLSLGCSVIGRPSNCGGISLLVRLLADFPEQRSIIIFGENDRKLHEELNPSVQKRHRPDCEECSLCWPGGWGARTTATRLADDLQRSVAVHFPLDSAKDVRELLRRVRGMT